MALSGTTCCCDGYFYADQVAEAVADLGLRGVIGQGVVDFPAPGVPDPAVNVAAAEAFVLRWRAHNPRIRPSIFCHAPYTCGDETLRLAKATSRAVGCLFQIHVAETETERRQSLSRWDRSPVARLDALGILDRLTLAVHAVHIDPADIAILARSGAGVAHAPESNLKLASGICPVPALRAAGVTVGLGTDGCASNNDLDMFGEMGTAARLHKAASGDPTVLDARAVLRMATIEGARAIGWADAIGSLEVGKAADLIVLAADRPHLVPLYHPESALVYAARGADVRHVFVDGRAVVRDGVLLTDDLSAVLAEVRAIAVAIARGR
jgi:5-methylthioadenosine/S-adenosylhomocysteine deaminase